MDDVSWDKALAWWPHGPLLGSSPRPQRGPKESVFVHSNKGGTNGDAKGESAGVSVFYWNDEGSPFEMYFPAIRDSGGIQVGAEYYPPGTAIPHAQGFGKQEVVVVRGHAARVKELRRSEGSNVDWRLVLWEEKSPHGGLVQWTISNHPDIYTREATLEFINGLQERRP